MLVFEVRGSIQNFINAVVRIPGLELIDVEELEGDDQDTAPAIYLLVPDAQALSNIASLWARWSDGQSLGTGFAPWRDVFATLRDIRPWGPQDRVETSERNIIAEELASVAEDAKIRLELELIFRSSDGQAMEMEAALSNSIVAIGGIVISSCRIVDIGYHAVLAELPAHAVRSILELSQTSIAGHDSVMHIRPQSIASSIEVEIDAEDSEDAQQILLNNSPPILALLDGVPVSQHQHLAGGLIVEDLFDLEPLTQVIDRNHGTAMASLILHGDKNSSEQPLGRKIHSIPVLGSNDSFPNNRLIIDMIYQAVFSMRDGQDPTAPEVLIVNLSLGNLRNPFHGRMSAWARLIDHLSYKYGILFVVSAGNHTVPFEIPSFGNFTEYEDASEDQRAHATIHATGQLIAQRRLLSPSESINCITVGAANIDAVTPAVRSSTINVDPFPNITITNPSSALGPGFAKSVKPDILMPGAKEHVNFVASGNTLSIRPSIPSRAHGLKVASPPRNGRENIEGYTSGTSAAAALASRTCHQIYDALELVYGNTINLLSHSQRATLLKALLVHTASWPHAASELIKQVLGPSDNRLHQHQKDNIRRFLGYGLVDAEAAVACAEDRATFWASGVLQRDQSVSIQVPIPACVNGQARPHSMSATLAWLTPVLAGKQNYRAVRLKLIEPDELYSLRVDAAKTQPDQNQSRRGTVFSRRWEGKNAPTLTDNHFITLSVQREPDQGTVIDEPIPFGLAITFTMPGVTQIYEEVRARLAVVPRVGIR